MGYSGVFIFCELVFGKEGVKLFNKGIGFVDLVGVEVFVVIVFRMVEYMVDFVD